MFASNSVRSPKNVHRGDGGAVGVPHTHGNFFWKGHSARTIEVGKEDGEKGHCGTLCVVRGPTELELERLVVYDLERELLEDDAAHDVPAACIPKVEQQVPLEHRPPLLLRSRLPLTAVVSIF